MKTKFYFVKSLLLFVPDYIYKIVCMNRCWRLFGDNVIRLYLVEVLLHIIDVLLHFICIPLQLLDQDTQLCGGSPKKTITESETLRVTTTSCHCFPPKVSTRDTDTAALCRSTGQHSDTTVFTNQKVYGNFPVKYSL